MSNRSWIRRFVIAGIWGVAASTWGSIGHHLLGLPDLGAVLPAAAATTVLVWPVRIQGGVVWRASSAARAR